METTDMNTQDKFTEILETFKLEAGRIVKDTITDLHCEWLPYVETDTEQNVNSRSEGVVSSILCGDFIVKDNYIIVKNNDISCHIRVDTSSFYTTMLDKIVDNMKECPKDLKIKNLESRVKMLKECKYNSY